MTALVHSAEDTKEHPFPEGVAMVEGDVHNAALLQSAMRGCEGVIDTIGGTTPYLATDLESSAAKVVLEVMEQTRSRRLVVISVLGAGDSKHQTGFFYEHLLLPIFLRGAIKDKNAMESEVRNSSVEWVIVRPPVLSDAAATGKVRVVPEGKAANKITRADLAQFLVEQLESETYLRQAVIVENS